jgi:hypothetical protein
MIMLTRKETAISEVKEVEDGSYIDDVEEDLTNPDHLHNHLGRVLWDVRLCIICCGL